jgi:hypothetical protein
LPIIRDNPDPGGIEHGVFSICLGLSISSDELKIMDKVFSMDLVFSTSYDTWSRACGDSLKCAAFYILNYNDSAATLLNPETSPLSNSQEHQTLEV